MSGSEIWLVFFVVVHLLYSASVVTEGINDDRLTALIGIAELLQAFYLALFICCQHFCNT